MWLCSMELFLRVSCILVEDKTSFLGLGHDTLWSDWSRVSGCTLLDFIWGSIIGSFHLDEVASALSLITARVERRFRSFGHWDLVLTVSWDADSSCNLSGCWNHLSVLLEVGLGVLLSTHRSIGILTLYSGWRCAGLPYLILLLDDCGPRWALLSRWKVPCRIMIKTDLSGWFFLSNSSLFFIGRVVLRLIDVVITLVQILSTVSQASYPLRV